MHGFRFTSVTNPIKAFFFKGIEKFLSVSTNVFLTHKKLIVGGGLKNNLDLERLRNIKSANLEGVIAGKSFYVGNIDLKEAQKVLDGNV